MEFLAKDWEATKRLGDIIESGEEQKIEFDISQLNAQCPIKCELPLRLDLPCRHWMYPIFINETFIPCLFIHPCWFFDELKRIKKTWEYEFLK